MGEPINEVKKPSIANSVDPRVEDKGGKAKDETPKEDPSARLEERLADLNRSVYGEEQPLLKNSGDPQKKRKITRPGDKMLKDLEDPPYYKNPPGIFQAPFKKWNLGIGLRFVGGGSIGGSEKAPPAFAAVKSDYKNNPRKYWQGVKGKLPDLYHWEEPKLLMHWNAGVELFLDLGQIRIGNDVMSLRSAAVAMRLMRNSWDVTKAAEFRTKLDGQNIFFVGLKLQGTEIFSTWLNYALDRYEYEHQNLVYKEVDHYGAKNTEELIATENHGSGTGWGHRLFADFEINVPLATKGKIDPRLLISPRLGINFGKLKSDDGEWDTKFTQLLIALGLGFQFNFFSE